MNRIHSIQKTHRSSGFTIIELMIVIGIIGILTVTGITLLNPTAQAKGSNCTQNLRTIYTAEVSVATNKLWTGIGSVNDADIITQLSGKTPGVAPLACLSSGTYTYGAENTWDANTQLPSKPVCSLGPPGGLNNTTFPSTQHNIRADATE